MNIYEWLVTALAVVAIAGLFWASREHSLYKSNGEISGLFMSMAVDPETKIVFESNPFSNEIYYVRAESPQGVLRFWNVNRWYSWASRGTFTPRDGDVIEWNDVMPGWRALRAMRKIVLAAEGEDMKGGRTRVWRYPRREQRA